MEINITLLKKMGYYAATAAEAFRAYGIPTATWKDTICPGMIFTAKQEGLIN